MRKDLNDSHKKCMPKTKITAQTLQLQKRKRVNVMFRHVSNEKERRLLREALASMRPFLYLNKLITGTCCHSLPIKVIRHIMDKIFVFCVNTLGFKHCTGCTVYQRLRTFKLQVVWLRHHHCSDHRWPASTDHTYSAGHSPCLGR